MHFLSLNCLSGVHEMAATEVTISVEGQTPDLLARPFLDAVDSSLDILRDLDASIAMRRIPTLRWAIASMHIGSPAVMTLRALPPSTGKDVSQDVVNHCVDGLDLLARGGSLPTFFSDDALNAAKRLSDLTSGNERVVIVRTGHRSVTVSHRISANVDGLVKKSYASDGSVEGVIEMVTIHERTYFRIYDAIQGWGVPCYFGQESIEDVRNALGKRASITGRLRSDRLGKPESMQVSGIRLLGSEPLPTPGEVRGVFKGMTGGLKAEEYLREVRRDD